MYKEIDIAFALLRAAFENNEEQITLNSQFLTLNSHDWWSLFRLMQVNHVAAMTAGVLATLDVPREVKIPWLAEADKSKRWYTYQTEVQQDIISQMSHHGIETLVLKGTHIAQYYPVPEMREFGDLDLYFYDRHDEADAVAQSELGVEVSNDAHHHSKYNYRGVTVESHYDFLNVHYPPSNRRYETMLKELAPSPTFEVLFLLRHMAVHFASARIMLRDLVDWTLTCRALNDKVDWHLVEKTIEDYGMTEFVSALNTIIEHRLGASLSLHDIMSRSIDISVFQKMEYDIVYGSPETYDKKADGFARLGWKIRRWRTLDWKRRMVFCDSKISLLVASLSSHTEKPRSILHKM